MMIQLLYGHAGRFNFLKNQKFIIEVFQKILELHKNSKLILIGDGEDKEELQNSVKQMKIENNVEFLGKRDDVNNLMQAMDIFLFPSLFEGLPVALIEAQTSDLLIFASSNISPEIKIDENLHFISLNESSKDWANMILDRYKCNTKRVDNTKIMTEAGYNIKTNCEFLENILLEESQSE